MSVNIEYNTNIFWNVLIEHVYKNKDMFLPRSNTPSHWESGSSVMLDVDSSFFQELMVNPFLTAWQTKKYSHWSGTANSSHWRKIEDLVNWVPEKLKIQNIDRDACKILKIWTEPDGLTIKPCGY